MRREIVSQYSYTEHTTQKRLPIHFIIVESSRFPSDYQDVFFFFLETIHSRNERYELAIAHNLAFQFSPYLPGVGDIDHNTATNIYTKV